MLFAAPQHLALIRRWLCACMLLVAAMVLVGGITRLTESGLSIVQWKLFSGVFPPLTHDAWEASFRAYQTSPEFLKKNSYFTLENYQRIYWLEYIHRLLGRTTGMAILLPFLFLSARRVLRGALLRRMGLACLLVAAQGAVGWVMVASGLVDDPRVSPVKLGLHLSLAFSLFALLLWTFLQLATPRGTPNRRRFWLVRLVLVAACAQMFLGALVAGNDAGMSYNTYPLMDGKFMPDGLYTLAPWWHNHITNIAMVQWQHRMLALILVMATLCLAVFSWREAEAPVKRWLKALFGVLALQFSLGVATLLSVVAIPLASAHQLAALLLLAVLVQLAYRSPARAQ